MHHGKLLSRTLRTKRRVRRTGLRWVLWKTRMDAFLGWLRVYKPGRGIQFFELACD